jgi:hypothetical protein
MSFIQSAQKTLEVKVRPYPNNLERPDQKGASRVYISREALYDLGLESGQKCCLWKSGQSPETGKEAIAWLTQKPMNKNVIQLSKVYQEAGHFKLGDDLNISIGGNLTAATNVTLREITEQNIATDGNIDLPPELDAKGLTRWEWFLGDALSMYICNGREQLPS